MDEGKPELFSGIGITTRGDLLLCVHPADSSAQRNYWLTEQLEQLSERCRGSVMYILIISASSRPPDKASREAIEAGFARLGARIRRAIAVPEGNPFITSAVRLMMNGQMLLTRRNHVFLTAANAGAAIARVREAASALTPDSAHISADLRRLRQLVTPPP